MTPSIKNYRGARSRSQISRRRCALLKSFEFAKLVVVCSDLIELHSGYVVNSQEDDTVRIFSVLIARKMTKT